MRKGEWRAGEEKKLGFGQSQMTFAIAEPLNPRAGWYRATVLLRKGYGTKHREFFPR